MWLWIYADLALSPIFTLLNYFKSHTKKKCLARDISNAHTKVGGMQIAEFYVCIVTFQPLRCLNLKMWHQNFKFSFCARACFQETDNFMIIRWHYSVSYLTLFLKKALPGFSCDQVFSSSEIWTRNKKFIVEIIRVRDNRRLTWFNENVSLIVMLH